MKMGGTDLLLGHDPIPTRRDNPAVPVNRFVAWPLPITFRIGAAMPLIKTSA